MLKIVPDIDKKFILERLSQEEILEKYLGIEVCFTGKVCSPLREDPNPTCTFHRAPGGTIVFKDWSGHFQGNCFEVVMYQYNLNFWDACKKIAADFNLSDTGVKCNKKPKVYEHKERTEETTIQVKWKKFDASDRAYWSSYGIDLATVLHFRSGPARFAWINKTLRYSYRPNDPCYAYHFGGEFFKLYFPLRDEWRFLGNYTGLQGYDQLPATGDLLVVTKSLKDVMFLFQMGIPAVAPPSESSILTEEQYEELSRRFKKIVCLYDFDLTGLRSANKMHRTYKIPRVFFTNGRFGTKNYGGKDVTDIAKRYGRSKAEETVKNLLWQVVKILPNTKTQKDEALF